MKKKIRKNLKLFRVAQGLTQEEMAEKIGYTRASYTAIEAGDRDGLDAFWYALQNAFGIDDEKMWALKKIDE